MLSFFFKRVLISFPTLLAVVTLVFFLVHLTPGDPFQGERALSPEALQALRHQYRLDLPLWQQYLLYLKDLLQGNLGMSLKYLGQSINDLLFPNNMGGFWVTLRLSVDSLLIAVPFGIIVGSYAGLHKDSWFDRVLVSANIIFTAIPTLVTGPLLVLSFAVTLNWFPAGGWGEGDLAHLFLPVLVLVLSYAPLIAFVTRGSVIEVLNTAYIRTARAKGLPTRHILFKHAIRPTLLPVVSLLGPTFASLLVGAVVTEQIFTLPGLGVLTTNAAINRDYNLIMAITLLGSFLTIGFNLLVDLFYLVLDPKIKA